MRKVTVLGAACLMSTMATGAVSFDPPGDRRVPPASVTAATLLVEVGVRVSNLWRHPEAFVPFPNGGEVAAYERALVLDDVGASASARGLVGLVDARSAFGLALESSDAGRIVSVTLGRPIARIVFANRVDQPRCLLAPSPWGYA